MRSRHARQLRDILQDMQAVSSCLDDLELEDAAKEAEGIVNWCSVVLGRRA